MGAVVLEHPRMLMKLLAQMEAFNGYGGSCYALPRSDGWTGSWTGLVGSSRRRDATLRCRGSTRKAENWTEHDGQVQEAEPGRVGCRVMLRRPEIQDANGYPPSMPIMFGEDMDYPFQCGYG